MRATTVWLAWVFLAAACNSSSPPGNVRPDAGTAPAPDAGASDAPSAPDAGTTTTTTTTALSRTTIVFAAALDGQAEPDLYASDGTTTTRLTSTPGAELYPAISPDRTQIAFVRDFQLFAIDASGGNEHLIAASTGRQRKINDMVYATTVGPAAWSPDGRQLAYPYPRPPDIVMDGSDAIDESYATTLHVINADGTGDHAVSDALDDTINWIGWGPADTLTFSQQDDCPDCAGGAWYGAIKSDGSGYRELRSGGSYPDGPLYELDWSPDGARWAYLKIVTGGSFRADSPATMYTSAAYSYSEQVLGSAPGWDPHWSPDGMSIAYIGADGIYVIGATGGTPQQIAAVVSGVRGLDW